MSLTLARLCGEWRLVSVNYELVSGNYKARGASGGNYEAQIVIFYTVAAINRFSRISWKAESRWGKLESRWRKRKAVEESRKPLKKAESRWRNRNAVEEDFLGFLGNRKAVEENWILCEENRSLGEGKSQFSQDILEVLVILGFRFWHQICYHMRAWIYLIGFNYS